MSSRHPFPSSLNRDIFPASNGCCDGAEADDAPSEPEFDENESISSSSSPISKRSPLRSPGRSMQESNERAYTESQ